jgi:putative cardiolipin synthase
MAEQAAEHPGDSGLYVLGSGLDAFAARVLLIDRAERAVDAQYYIFHDDLTGRFLLSRMLRAADRGVRVRLLIDDLGSWNIDPLLAGLAAHEHFEVRLFNPIARGPWKGLSLALDFIGRFGHLNHRMHNKMLSVDGAAAVVGGRNIGDEYFDAAPDTNFADLDLLALGPVLDQLGYAFDEYWNSPFVASVSAWKTLNGGPEQLEQARAELMAHEDAAKDSPYAVRVRESNLVQQVEDRAVSLYWAPTRAVADRPEKVIAKGDEVEATLLRTQLGPLLDDVATRLDVVSPYFVPLDRGVEFLREQREKGVAVRVLTNSLAATDVPAVHAGYSSYRKEMLEAGVELFELRSTGDAVARAKRSGLFGSSAASLHAKSFLIDDETVFVGSLNLDPRSIDLNTELGLVVESAELTARQEGTFEAAAGPEFSWRVSLEDGRLVWHGEQDGVAVVATTEPDTSWWKRFKVRLLKLLPIEGQI